MQTNININVCAIWYSVHLLTITAVIHHFRINKSEVQINTTTTIELNQSEIRAQTVE